MSYTFIKDESDIVIKKYIVNEFSLNSLKIIYF